MPPGSIKDNPPMATKKPKGLGLGLEALLGPTVREAPEGGSSGSDGEPRTLAARPAAGRALQRAPA